MFSESFMNYTIVFSKYHSISEIGIVDICVELILADVMFNIFIHSNYRIKFMRLVQL